MGHQENTITESDYLTLVKLMIKNPNINLKDNIEKIICTAIKNRQLKVVKFLSTLPGANIDRIFRVSSEYGNLELVKFLSNVVDITIDNNEALQLASKYGHFNVVKFLLTFV